MEIETVTFRRLYNLGNYENEVIEATALVNERGPEHALDTLRTWCDVQHQAHVQRMNEASDMEALVRGNEYTLSSLKTDIAVMERTWRKSKDFLEKLGIDLPSLYYKHELSDDDIPF